MYRNTGTGDEPPLSMLEYVLESLGLYGVRIGNFGFGFSGDDSEYPFNASERILGRDSEGYTLSSQRIVLRGG